jgi:hypothetical protein
MLKFKNHCSYVRSKGSRILKTENSSAWKVNNLTNGFLSAIINTNLQELGTLSEPEVDAQEFEIYSRKLKQIELAIQNNLLLRNSCKNANTLNQLGMELDGLYEEKEELDKAIIKTNKYKIENIEDPSINALALISEEVTFELKSGKTIIKEIKPKALRLLKLFLSRFVKKIECYADGIDAGKEKKWLLKLIRNKDIVKLSKEFKNNPFCVFDGNKEKVINKKEDIDKVIGTLKYDKPFIRIHFANDTIGSYSFKNKSNEEEVNNPILVTISNVDNKSTNEIIPSSEVIKGIKKQELSEIKNIVWNK